MVNIENHTLALPLGDVEKALKNGWRSEISASHNLGEALRNTIKSSLAPRYSENVRFLLPKDKVEDFIDPNIHGYVTSRKGTMAYLAALYPSKVVLVNIQLRYSTDVDEKPDLVIPSLSKNAPDGNYSGREAMESKIWKARHSHSFRSYSYDDIADIRHLKVTAVAHLNPGEYVFKRDLPEWGLNFSFSRAILRLCNLQDLPFTVPEKPSGVFAWIPLIASEHNGPNTLKEETFRIVEPEEVKMEGYPDLLCLESRFHLKSQCFVKQGGAYQITVPLTHREETIGSLELNFVEEAENAKDF